MSSEQLHVRLPSWFKRKLKEEADKQGENLSEYVKTAVEQRQEREKGSCLNYVKQTSQSE